ncbi:MAG: hypothetical protein Q4E18_07805, partial [Clostridia bacterium]|nr:hypothetical protein [Clostridia bacterium]
PRRRVEHRRVGLRVAHERHGCNLVHGNPPSSLERFRRNPILNMEGFAVREETSFKFRKAVTILHAAVTPTSS